MAPDADGRTAGVCIALLLSFKKEPSLQHYAVVESEGDPPGDPSRPPQSDRRYDVKSGRIKGRGKTDGGFTDLDAHQPEPIR